MRQARSILFELRDEIQSPLVFLVNFVANRYQDVPVHYMLLSFSQRDNDIINKMPGQTVATPIRIGSCWGLYIAHQAGEVPPLQFSLGRSVLQGHRRLYRARQLKAFASDAWFLCARGKDPSPFKRQAEVCPQSKLAAHKRYEISGLFAALCIFLWRAVLKTVMLQRLPFLSVIYRILKILHFSPHSLRLQAPEGSYLL